MKKLLADLREAIRARLRAGDLPHDDALRANQFNEPRRTLTPWLILIG
jgi:hypothetical protein